MPDGARSSHFARHAKRKVQELEGCRRWIGQNANTSFTLVPERELPDGARDRVRAAFAPWPGPGALVQSRHQRDRGST